MIISFKLSLSSKPTPYKATNEECQDRKIDPEGPHRQKDPHGTAPAPATLPSATPSPIPTRVAKIAYKNR